MMYLNIHYIQVINFYTRTEGSVEQILLKAKKKKKGGNDLFQMCSLQLCPLQPANGYS